MRVDRRVQRHNQTIEEILDLAIQVMAEDGVAALSLAEVARRMGMRPPSLYQYFPSKLAVYDALFERGARQTLAVMESYQSRIAENPLEGLAAAQAAWNDWVMANPVLAQLLYWRPVPGFEPSPKAYQPALQLYDLGRAALQAAVDAGQLAPAAVSDEGDALYTILMAGVISQQLANEPAATAATGRFTRLTPTVLDMFVRYYAPTPGVPKEGEPDDRLPHPGRAPSPD
jgi:AcrR family transcriptional regulator